jgi:hypothetical protein
MTHGALALFSHIDQQNLLALLDFLFQRSGGY